MPDATLKIENPAAVTTKANPKAKDYLNFVLSADGQAEFVRKGFRPVVAGTPTGDVQGANDPAKPFPTPSKLFTIAELGGWDAVNTKFFDEKTGIVPKVQAETGKASDRGRGRPRRATGAGAAAPGRRSAPPARPP